MRQGQPQNRQRSRGRGNNNRNNNNRQNLNRSMESNGPDVRIRGTAAHIAEKYETLARDAQSAGDSVAAESYWQHAEHYNRLIAAAQATAEAQREARAAQQNDEQSDDDNRESGGRDGGGRGRNRGRNRDQNRDERDDSSKAASDADDDAQDEKPAKGRKRNVNGSGPQPTIDGDPAEVALRETPEAEAADKGESDDEKPAPRKRAARRPRKSESDEVPAAVAETKAELPAFISGGVDD